MNFMFYVLFHFLEQAKRVMIAKFAWQARNEQEISFQVNILKNFSLYTLGAWPAWSVVQELYQPYSWLVGPIVLHS